MIKCILILSIIVIGGSASVGVADNIKNDGQADILTQDVIDEQVSSKLQAYKIKRRGAKPLHDMKMGNSIRGLLQKWKLHEADGEAKGIGKAALKTSFRPQNPFVQMQVNGAVQIYVTVKNSNEDTLEILEQFGLEIELHNTKLMKIQGWIDIELLEALSELPEVIQVTAPKYGRTNSGSVTTEGDAILKSDELRALGFSGEGIRVGILSDGANDWPTAQASGDVPAEGITTYGSCIKRLDPDKSNCESRRTCNEGTAMAEIIHDLAPAAQLAVGAVGTTLEFIQRIGDLINNFGANIIVDDIGFYGEPYFEDGDVADAVATTTSSVVFVSSAGNSADGHYEREYSQLTGDTWHDFGVAEGGTSDIDQGIVIPPEDYIWVIMQWNDLFTSPSNDYDLYLVDDIEVVAQSNDDQSVIESSPIEGFCYYNPTTEEQVTWLYVNKYVGSSRRLEIFTLGAWAAQYNHPEGSIIGHSAVSNNVTVGAIQADDDGHDTVTFYSSRGPSRIDFPSLETRTKPDLVGIDGVSVTGTGGFSNPFYGTSASAPHVAAIAAQLMSVSPTVSLDNVRNALKNGASDLGPDGLDYDSGHGIADALQSYEILEGVTPGDVNGDGDVDLEDAIGALQLVSDSASGIIVKRADVNDDNKIGIPEAIYILDDISN